MSFLDNPIVARMLVLLVAAGSALYFGIAVMRRVRRRLVDANASTANPTSPEAMPLQAYTAVIQQLKQQKHELQSMQQVEKRRAKTSETINTSIISGLSCGVLFFTANGLVRQANSASKQILGFSSPLGMSVEEVFRQAMATAPDGSRQNLSSLVHDTLNQKSFGGRLKMDYLSPAGMKRLLDVTLTPVQSQAGELFGMACLVNDQTEMFSMRTERDARNETSMSMALELRKSLAAISAYAAKLSFSSDAASARQTSTDIAAEVEHLDKTIGSFLAGDATKAAAGVS
ncbi:MAG: hypothetical protein NVS9B5_05080 [Terriglobales bacterium]